MEYKICMIGNGGVGKTSIVSQLVSELFTSRYFATMGVEVHPISLNTNYGKIVFQVWDCAGQERYGGLRDGYYIESQACIGVIEKGNQLSVRMLNQDLTHELLRDLPTVIVLNKMEIQTNKDDVHKDVFPEAISVSAKQNENLQEPFLILARKLTGFDDLIFI